MTGGVAVILGTIGRNFAAGMSGGIAYIYNPDNSLDNNNFNMEMIGLEDPSEENKEELKELILNHYQYTESDVAREILEGAGLKVVLAADQRKFLEGAGDFGRADTAVQVAVVVDGRRHVRAALVRPQPVRAGHVAATAGPHGEPSANSPDAKYKGLCVNCEHRETCTLPKPKSGVWHCEEYE